MVVLDPLALAAILLALGAALALWVGAREEAHLGRRLLVNLGDCGGERRLLNVAYDLGVELIEVVEAAHRLDRLGLVEYRRQWSGGPAARLTDAGLSRYAELALREVR